jgi:hypothetical protein
MKSRQEVYLDSEEAKFLAEEQIDSTEAFILGFLKGFNRETNKKMADEKLWELEIEVRGYK